MGTDGESGSGYADRPARLLASDLAFQAAEWLCRLLRRAGAVMPLFAAPTHHANEATGVSWFSRRVGCDHVVAACPSGAADRALDVPVICILLVGDETLLSSSGARVLGTRSIVHAPPP